MKIEIIINCLLVALVGAKPNRYEYGRTTCPSVDIVANFDDIAVNPAANSLPVPTPYKGLYYQAFNPSRPTINSGQPIIVPHSPQNYIYTTATFQSLRGTAMISVNYADSQVKSFSPKSFYFACVGAQTNSALGLPFECFGTVTGYKGNDNQVSNSQEVCSQQVHYLPSTQLGSQQMAFTGPLKSCFQDIQFLIVTLNNPGSTAPLQPLTSFQLDDFSYSYKSC